MTMQIKNQEFAKLVAKYVANYLRKESDRKKVPPEEVRAVAVLEFTGVIDHRKGREIIRRLIDEKPEQSEAAT